MRVKRPLLFAGPIAALLFSAWGFHQVVPVGLRLHSVEPFYMWSRDLGSFPSPEGTNAVQIVVNDAGAMHSGNHWVWIIHSTRLSGQRILAEGYVEFVERDRERFPLRWVSEGEIEVTFCQGRHSGVQITRTVPVPR